MKQNVVINKTMSVNIEENYTKNCQQKKVVNKNEVELIYGCSAMQN